MNRRTPITIARFEADEAILTFEDGSEVQWPKKYLPDDAKEGTQLSLCPIDEAHDPKELLNELLQEE